MREEWRGREDKLPIVKIYDEKAEFAGIQMKRTCIKDQKRVVEEGKGVRVARGGGRGGEEE